jgi:ribosomal protein L11 methyltransferase
MTQLIALYLQTTHEHAEAISDCLLLLGAETVTLEDRADQPIYEPAPEANPLWEELTLCALFPPTADISAISHFLIIQFFLSPSAIYSTCIDSAEWTHRWPAPTHPLVFGQQRRLWVFPNEALAKQACEPYQMILEPGLAFGTGTHPTTALCLAFLADQLESGSVVVDYGCGSGILAIAALKLGANKVYAVDHDPQALGATQDNAKRNAIRDDQLLTCLPEQLPSLQADLIIANILANPLIALVPRFHSLLRPGGKIALSGILSAQQEDVSCAYQPLLKRMHCQVQADWLLVRGVK